MQQPQGEVRRGGQIPAERTCLGKLVRLGGDSVGPPIRRIESVENVEAFCSAHQIAKVAMLSNLAGYASARARTLEAKVCVRRDVKSTKTFADWADRL